MRPPARGGPSATTLPGRLGDRDITIIDAFEGSGRA
jgi:hypothetical protein